jgi:hypothetical protein
MNNIYQLSENFILTLSLNSSACKERALYSVILK